jgi:cell division protein FtsI/penicillin-binding protein 2
MLETTVTEGTARRAFHERGRYVLGSIRAAGKTGSLASRKPYRDFSWFIGWAPKEEPRIAVAAVIVNGAVWRVRAPYVAREALRTYLEPSKDSRKGRRPRSRLTEGAGSAINHAPFS